MPAVKIRASLKYIVRNILLEDSPIQLQTTCSKCVPLEKKPSEALQ